MTLGSFCRAALLVIGIALVVDLASADDYKIAEGNESMLVALGCFWCAEQAFEQYAPGVVEAVSGFAGGELQNPSEWSVVFDGRKAAELRYQIGFFDVEVLLEMEKLTKYFFLSFFLSFCVAMYLHSSCSKLAAYRNHDGHYEVILIEYDPSKTSYEVLVNYAYRNMDPFDAFGQFCDKGQAYYPAIFYETEEEREIAEDVLTEILEAKDWDLDDIAAPLLKRPTFWKGG